MGTICRFMDYFAGIASSRGNEARKKEIAG